jgi:predicted MFS family arabinose efflux permease
MFRAIAASYREAFAGLSRPVWILSVASLINRSGTMVLPFLVLYLTEERGFTTAGAGQVLALYGLGAMVASFLGGWLCDRFDPRMVMKGSLILTGLGFLALGQMRSHPAILATIVILSLAGETFRPANAAALTRASDPAERTRSFALYRLAINLGMTLGPTVGGFLALRSYDLLFVVDGVTCILAAGLLWLVPGEPAPAKETKAAAAPARSPWRDRPLLVMLFLLFLMNVVTFQVVSTYTLSLRDLYGFPENWIGLTLAVNTLVIVLFEMVLVHRVARYDPLRMTGLGAFLLCFGLALLPLGRGFAYAAFTVVIWSVGEMLAFPIIAGAIANRADAGSVGRYMGLMNLAFATAYVIAPLAGTWVYQNLGPQALWYGCGAVGLLVWGGFEALAASEKRLALNPTPPAPPEAA